MGAVRYGQSRELLAGLPTAWAEGHAPWLPTAIILAGAAAYAVLGLALRPGRKAYGAALLLMLMLMLMLIMTVLATAIHPAWWLHPFGPLTKNLPIAAILWVLLQDEATSPQKP